MGTETQEIINPGETGPSPFAPSLASQADALLGGAQPVTTQVIEFKPEDLEGIFSMPFDAASFITKVQDLELSKKELEQLCRIWAKPFGVLSQKYPSFPWVIAGTMTMGIIVEKVLIYYIAVAEREKNRRKEAPASSVEEARREELERANMSREGTGTVAL